MISEFLREFGITSEIFCSMHFHQRPETIFVEKPFTGGGYCPRCGEFVFQQGRNWVVTSLTANGNLPLAEWPNINFITLMAICDKSKSPPKEIFKRFGIINNDQQKEVMAVMSDLGHHFR